MPAYINDLGASGVDGVYQIADTIRYTIDSNTHEPCNPSWCTDYYFRNVNINGTVNGRVAYKHEDYYNEGASYWIAWHTVPICRTAWWIADSLGRSRQGGAIAIGRKRKDNKMLGIYSYTPPLEDWGDEDCGNGVELSLYGGDNNKPGIRGEPYVGSTLTGDYEYYDAEGDTEGRSIFRWLRCDTLNGSYEPVPGATGKTYTLTEQDENMFLKFEVKPVAVTGNSPGNAAISAYAGIGPIIAIPEVYLVTGAGEAKAECNGNYYFRGYIDDPGSYDYGAPYWQKRNEGNDYEGFYLYGYEGYHIYRYKLCNSLNCSHGSSYYRSDDVGSLFPPEGAWCESYNYSGECEGDTINVVRQY